MVDKNKYIIPIPSSKPKVLIADHTAWCGDDILSGVNLAKILNEDGNSDHIHRVNHIMTKYNMRLKTLCRIDNININNGIGDDYFYQLLYKDTKRIVKEALFPRIVETHISSLISAKYKNIINGDNRD